MMLINEKLKSLRAKSGPRAMVRGFMVLNFSFLLSAFCFLLVTSSFAQSASSAAVQSSALKGQSAGTALPSLGGYVADDKYKLRAGDKVSFQILEDRMFDEKDVPKPLTVADSGELDLPYIGRIAAADRTCKEVAEDIKARLEKDYYYRATVVLALDVANKVLGRVYVWGQVRTQGPVELAVNETMTAGKAILRAGGFGDFANKKKVRVVRGGQTEAEAKQTFELNMVEILEGGKTEKDITLQPDDFILVPSRLINF